MPIHTLHDYYEPTLNPILHLKPLFCLQNGIYSPIQRFFLAEKNQKKLNITGNRNKQFYQKFLHDIEFNINSQINKIYQPLDLLNDFSANLQKDISLLHKDNFSKSHKNIHIQNNKNDTYIHKKAQIHKYTVFDLNDGAIVIDEDATIFPFTFLKGPLYIGKQTIVTSHSKISSTRIADHCRIGGEISHSYIGNFTNKVHEGFLGHSIIGDWVNLGALTTTSNLKNNYKNITLKYQEQSYPTNTNKFGSILGDFTKTAIATMLNTGTIIDIGSCLFHERERLKYYNPFFWGGSQANTYNFDKFIDDHHKILKRRGEKFNPQDKELLKNIHFKSNKY